jgi:hypothetical protein
MKKLLLALSLITFISRGQTPYNKLLGSNTTDWYIFQDDVPGPAYKLSSVSSIPLPNYGKYSAHTDTTVLGKDYKKYFDVYTNPSFIFNTHIGYLREDTVARKVYFLDKTTLVENILYDFSLNVGDSLNLNFPNTSGNFPKGYYKVKLITNVMTRVGLRKQFNLKHVSGSDTLKYIESVGSIIHPTYMGQSNYVAGQFITSFSGCKYPYNIGLACKYSNNVKFFQSCTYITAQSYGCIFKYDSCNYWNTCSGIKENTLIQKLSLYPNPATNATVLNFFANEDMVITINVLDVMGRTVKTICMEKIVSGENTINLNLTGIQQGSYFLNVKVREQDIQTPFIIIH